jgi:hypothetical protein
MLEYIIGGFLLAIFVIMIMFVPPILANLTIDVLELIKPGIRYNNIGSKKIYYLNYQITNLWGVIIFIVLVWCMLLYIYPTLISLIK